MLDLAVLPVTLLVVLGSGLNHIFGAGVGLGILTVIFGTARWHRPVEGFIGRWDLASCVRF